MSTNPDSETNDHSLRGRYALAPFSALKSPLEKLTLARDILREGDSLLGIDAEEPQYEGSFQRWAIATLLTTGLPTQHHSPTAPSLQRITGFLRVLNAFLDSSSSLELKQKDVSEWGDIEKLLCKQVAKSWFQPSDDSASQGIALAPWTLQPANYAKQYCDLVAETCETRLLPLGNLKSKEYAIDDLGWTIVTPEMDEEGQVHMPITLASEIQALAREFDGQLRLYHSSLVDVAGAQTDEKRDTLDTALTYAESTADALSQVLIDKGAEFYQPQNTKDIIQTHLADSLAELESLHKNSHDEDVWLDTLRSVKEHFDKASDGLGELEFKPRKPPAKTAATESKVGTELEVSVPGSPESSDDAVLHTEVASTICLRPRPTV